MSTIIEHRVFGLEGMDGSGKTTVGKMVAEQTGGQYLYCMDGNPLKPYRNLFDQQRPEIRFLYYVAIPLVNYLRIEDLRKSSDVFLDRTVASTIAYHLAYGVSRKWIKLIPHQLLKQIDTMLYFTVSESERRRRLLQRQTTDSVLTHNDLKSLELDRQIDTEYRKVFPEKTTIIPTDDKDPSKITKEVIERIYGSKQTN